MTDLPEWALREAAKAYEFVDMTIHPSKREMIEDIARALVETRRAAKDEMRNRAALVAAAWGEPEVADHILNLPIDI